MLLAEEPVKIRTFIKRQAYKVWHLGMLLKAFLIAAEGPLEMKAFASVALCLALVAAASAQTNNDGKFRSRREPADMEISFVRASMRAKAVGRKSSRL